MKRKFASPLLAFLLAGTTAGRLHAASVSWTGAGDNSTWSDGLNWFPSGEPGAADDVTISSSLVVSADSGINVNSLTLGNGVSTTTLLVKNTIVHIGTLVVSSSSTLRFDVNLQANMGDVTVQAGGLVTQTGPIASSTAAVRLKVDTFTLTAGATVALAGRGFAGGGALAGGSGGGAGATGSISVGAGGGGHGGQGGDGSNASGLVGIGGSAYDSQTLPVQMGSGGGGALAPCFGGSGGGYFELDAGTATLDGLIDADGSAGIGGCSSGGGGGAGGAVNISALYLHGGGTITARGGTGGAASSTGGGGGGGGRVSIRIASGTTANFSVSVLPGSGGTAPGAGGVGASGTTYVNPKIYTGKAGGSCSAAGNWFSSLSPAANENILFGSTSPLTGCTWDIAVFSASLGSFTVTPEYQGVIVWSALFSDIAGDFTLAGGTLTSNNAELKVAGDWKHAGGVFHLDQGTVTFNGTGAQTVSHLPGSYFRNFRVTGAAGSLAQASDLDIRGNLTLGSRFANAAAGWRMRLRGDLLDTPPAAVGDTRWILEGTTPQSVSTGPYYSLTVQNQAGVSFSGTASPAVGPGELRIDPGAILDATGKDIELSGGFTDAGGTFTVTGATLSFTASTGTVYLDAPGTRFNHVDVRKIDGTLVWTTSSVVDGNLTLRSTSTLSLVNGSTLSVRGRWTQVENAVFSPGSGAVLFDGVSPQVVYATATGSFHHFLSSNPAGVVLSTGITVLGDLEIHAGVLDFSTRSVRLRGDFRQLGSSAPAVSMSTVTLEGTGVQSLDLGPGSPALDTLVVTNSSGTVLAGGLTLARNFRVAPGAVFDGRDKSLTLTGGGALWDTAGADYRSYGGGRHLVDWNPGGTSRTLYVAAGSTVNARVDVRSTVKFLGDFYLGGHGNLLNAQPGVTFVASGTAVYLQDTSDMVFPADGAYVRDASSWLVYRGSGTNRGVFLSTGPFGNVRLSPATSTSTFAFNDITLDGNLVVDTGTLSNNGNATLTLLGDLANNGGTVQFHLSSTGTVRFAGSRDVSVTLGPRDVFGDWEIATASAVVLSGGNARLAGDLRLRAGELRGGAARVDIAGDWLGTGGSFTAQSSTIVFSSAGAGARSTFTDIFGVALNGLDLQVSTMIFSSTFTAAVLTSTRPGGLLVFTPAGADSYRAHDLAVNGGSPSGRVRLRSSVAGTRFALQVLAASTVTFSDVQDSNAAGIVIQVNDGDSVDSGNNINWNFKPNLVILAPGETFVEGSGKSGSPGLQTAGTPFQVTLRAVSDRFKTLTGAAVTAGVRTADPYDPEPADAALSGGIGVFSVDLRVAEPNPYASRIDAVSADVFSGSFTTVNVQPAVFSRLQLVLDGEQTVPGSPAGRTGLPSVQVVDQPFGATVRAVDAYWNLKSGVTDVVALTTATVSSVTLPSAAALSSGFLVYGGIFAHTTDSFRLGVLDSTNFSISSDTSLTIEVFPLSTSSPTVAVGIPLGAVVPTLGGSLVGTAGDTVSVSEVRVAIEDSGAGLYFDWTASSFGAAAPEFKRASLEPLNSPQTQWSLSFPDDKLTSGKEYFVVIQASNPSQLVTTVESTFTFSTAGLAFAPSGGEGTASVAPSAVSACSALIATVTVTVGSSGLGRGGAIALRVPEGWSRPGRLASGTPAVGELGILTASPAYPGSTELSFSPERLGETLLGEGWTVLSVSTAGAGTFAPGSTLDFVYHGLPPSGERAKGDHPFDVRTRSDGDSPLVSIGTVPVFNLTPRPAAALRFASYAPVRLSPLQTSPTMHIEVTDECGNLSAPSVPAIVGLTAGPPGGGGLVSDSQAAFFPAGGGGPVGSVTVAAGQTTSPGFYFKTSTSGVAFELIRATAVFSTSASADRLVELASSSAPLSDVSIDTGAFVQGSTRAVVVAGQAGSRAVVRFRLPDAAVPWEVSVATDSTFHPVLARKTGVGDPDRTFQVPLDARLCDSGICSFLAPSTYSVRVAAGGTSVSQVLSLVVARTPHVAGRLGAAGAGAVVRARGPGTGEGAYAVASSTGFFLITGLQAGGTYTLTADTDTIALGGNVRLSAVFSGAIPPVDVGTVTLPSPTFIRVNAGIPFSAPEEVFGRAQARDSAGRTAASGSLHFSSGSSRSDDGGNALGRNASTWTLLAVPPGTYSLDLSVGRLGLSTGIAGVSVSDGGVYDASVQFLKRANVYGSIVLPSTGPFGAAVSVEARLSTESAPAVLAAAFIPPTTTGVLLTSAPYALYGLAPGSWTVTAFGEGFLGVSTSIVVGTSDIGDPATKAGNLDITLVSGAVLTGTVTVRGDTSSLRDPDDPSATGFSVSLEAYAPASARRVRGRVKLSTDSAETAGTFRLAGLATGQHVLSAFLPGFEPEVPGGTTVSVSTAGGSASIALNGRSGVIRMSVDLPPGPGGACRAAPDWRRISLRLEGPGRVPSVLSDITLFDDLQPGATETFHCSSMTLVAPGLGTGLHDLTLQFGETGAFQELSVPVVHAATAAVRADLRASTFTVSGRATFSGLLRLVKDGFAVNVSSVPGLVAHSSAAYYCLLSSSAPLRLSGARVELLPLPEGKPAAPAALGLALSSSCLSYAVAPSSASPSARVAFASDIASDGTYAISGVPRGAYLLRVPGVFDAGTGGGRAAPVERVVRVSGDAVENVALFKGHSISGGLFMPKGVVASRSVGLSLLNARGRVVRTASLHFNNTASVGYAFENLAEGEYVLQAADSSRPRRLAAEPLRVVLSGGDLPGQDVRLAEAGGITGSLAAETLRSDGTREYVRVTQASRSLLPGLRIAARPPPGASGGVYPARGEDCAEDRCERIALDSDGRFSVEGVLPGEYEVGFEIQSGGRSPAGALDLVSGRRSGVRVDAGRITDLGVVRLRAGLSIGGRVTASESGTGLANVSVRARPSAHSPSADARGEPPSTVSGADGRYELKGLDPDIRFYDVSAGEDGAGGAADRERAVVRSLDVRSTTTLDLSLAPAPFYVIGRAAASDASALYHADSGGTRPGARIFVRKSGAVPEDGPLGDVDGISAVDGTFAVGPLAPGSYLLTATALDRTPARKAFSVVSSSPDVGTLTLSAGGTLSGRIRDSAGAAPTLDEVASVFAAAPGRSGLLVGRVLADSGNGLAVGYSVSGFLPGVEYRVILAGKGRDIAVPDEGASVVFSSAAESRELDLVFRRRAPVVLAKSRRSGSDFLLRLEASAPFRARIPADDDLTSLLSLSHGAGTLYGLEMSADRSALSAVYSPAVGESSFTVALRAYSSVEDPDSTDTVNGQFLHASTFSFYAGLDGYHRARIPNVTGGALVVEGDAGRVRLPEGAFFVDPSSAVLLTLQKTSELVADSRRFAPSGGGFAPSGGGFAPSGEAAVSANLDSLRYGPEAYPPALLSALAATPPDLSPLSAFYDVLLPLGVRTALAAPVELTLAYSAGSDPRKLNVYWYNEAANAYVLQQDVSGAAPVIDEANRTITLKVDHFSTFVLFETGVSVISGSGFGGGEIEAFNFPNPFDLRTKTVTPIHGIGPQTVRGTMIRFALPPDAGGGASIDIYSVSGQKVRTIELGNLRGGQFYYQPWDGRNDFGRDVADGVYFGRIQAGGKSKFFKMAVLQ